jgi:hypothetical protein
VWAGPKWPSPQKAEPDSAGSLQDKACWGSKDQPLFKNTLFGFDPLVKNCLSHSIWATSDHKA